MFTRPLPLKRPLSFEAARAKFGGAPEGVYCAAAHPQNKAYHSSSAVFFGSFERMHRPGRDVVALKHAAARARTVCSIRKWPEEKVEVVPIPPAPLRTA